MKKEPLCCWTIKSIECPYIKRIGVMIKQGQNVMVALCKNCKIKKGG